MALIDNHSHVQSKKDLPSRLLPISMLINEANFFPRKESYHFINQVEERKLRVVLLKFLLLVVFGYSAKFLP